MIHYLIGDATQPIGAGHKYIVHIVNDIGAWGKGFVLALSKRWVNPEQAYRRDWKSYSLGQVQPVSIPGTDIIVWNMFAQHGIYTYKDLPPIRYVALEACLEEVTYQCGRFPDTTVHMPRIGCGLAGGDWKRVEEIINSTLVAKCIEVYVYDLPKKY